MLVQYGLLSLWDESFGYSITTRFRGNLLQPTSDGYVINGMDRRSASYRTMAALTIESMMSVSSRHWLRLDSK